MKISFRLGTMLIICIFQIVQASLNSRPIIGIVSVPSQFPDTHSPNKFSNIDGALVSFIEAGGSRVVPIPWNLSQDKLLSLLQSVNGVVIGGDSAQIFESASGGRTPTEFTNSISRILNFTIELNKNGTYFPLVGINSGFTAICALIAQDLAIFDQVNYDQDPKFYRLNIKDYDNRVFSLFQDYFVSQLEKNSVLSFRNSYTIKNYAFLKNQNLNGFFDVVATISKIALNEEIAVAEAKEFPIYVLQFSPHLSNRFSSSSSTTQSKLAYSLIANFFVNEGRQNSQRFSDASKEDLNLIYKKDAEFVNGYFPRVYFLPNN